MTGYASTPEQRCRQAIRSMRPDRQELLRQELDVRLRQVATPDAYSSLCRVNSELGMFDAESMACCCAGAVRRAARADWKSRHPPWPYAGCPTAMLDYGQAAEDEEWCRIMGRALQLTAEVQP